MKLNFSASAPIVDLDFETQSEDKLATARTYALHPSTRALTCVARHGDEELRLGPYLDGDAKQKLVNFTEGRVVCAHNAGFDEAIWTLTEKLPEREWMDTLPCARAAGLPGSLEAIGQLLTGRGKDKMGEKLIDLLCKVKPGKAPPAIGLAHHLLMEYNARDTQLLGQIRERVRPFAEPAVMQVDRNINDRGVPVDVEFLRALQQLYSENKELLEQEFAEQTGGVNPRSAKQVKEWMRKIGFNVPIVEQAGGKEVESIGKMAMEKLELDPEAYFVGEGDHGESVAALLEAMDTRKGIVRVGSSKVAKALELLDSDGRIREQFGYGRAHTLRWGGQGVQFQNFPHAIKGLMAHEVEPNLASVKFHAEQASLKSGKKISTTDVLNVIVRHMVRCGMAVADYAAVELRGAAWVAGEENMLGVLRDPDASMYIDMGIKLFGRKLDKNVDFHEYNIAKMMVLSCIYGVSGARFEYRCKLLGVDTSSLSKVGLDVDAAVKLFRKSYPKIPETWRAYNDAFLLALKGVTTEAGKCMFARIGSDVHVVLPSGRPFVYRNARIEQRVPGYQKIFGMPESPVPTIVFDLPRFDNGRCREGFLYGSRIFENIVQALCRDLLADTLVKTDGAGMRPFLHVHDEIACETERWQEFAEIMSLGPKWSEGFPVKIEGYRGDVWTKQPREDLMFAAMGGKILAS